MPAVNQKSIDAIDDHLRRSAGLAADAKSTPVMPGTSTVSLTISVVYTIQ